MSKPEYPGGPAPTLADRLGGIFEHPWFIPVVAILGLLVRLALLVVTSRHPTVFQDEVDYESIAVSLWKKHQYAMYDGLTAFRPPGEPLFIAAVYAALGQVPHVVRLLQAVALTALPFLCASLGRRIGLSVRLANLGALLANFHPGLAYAATTIYPTTLTAVALTAGLLYTSIAVENDKGSERTSDSIKGGIALGLAGSLTTTFVPLPLLAALYCAWKRRMRAAVIVCLLGMLPTVIWLARTDHVFGQVVLATNGGLNLFLGANDQTTPLSGNKLWLPENDPGINGRDELGLDRMSSRRAVSWIRDHPLRYAGLCVSRALLVVDSIGNTKTKGLHSGLGAQLIALSLLPVTILGVIGLFLERRKAVGFLTGAALLLVVASSALTIVKPRFRFPCDPALSVFAAAAIPRIWMLRRRPTGTKNTSG